MKKNNPTKDKIIEAALKLFSVKGYNGSTTKEIASEAGVAEGTIYRYFNSKKDLLVSVAQSQVVDILLAKVKELPIDNEEVFLKEIVKNRMELIKKNLPALKMLFIESQFHPEIKKELFEGVLLRAINVMECYIKEKIDEGTFRNINPKIAVRSLAGMAQIFILWQELDGNTYVKFDEDEVIETIVDIYLNGIRTKAEIGGKLNA